MTRQSIKALRAELAEQWRTTKMTREEFRERAAAIDAEAARRRGPERPWCQARTAAQESGGSWASASWSCGNHATTERGGTPMCAAHARRYDREAARS
jgi:hypothetical protein